ncbi:MAG: hypothetical protein ACFFER_01195 [Candidatus Thorarchaeota archaeon]
MMQRRIRKLPRQEPCWLTLLLFIIFTFGPLLLGLDIMPEMGILAAIGAFVGKLGAVRRTSQTFIMTMLVCAIIGFFGIGLGIILPEMVYQSIAHFGELNAIVIGVFITCFTAFLQFTRSR